MLIPAVMYKEQIERYSDELRYTERMMFYNGCTETGRIQIATEPTEGRYQWAIVDEDRNLIGYIAYMVDYYSSNAYGFGLISFADNKRVMAGGILQAMDHIKKMNIHRIEWRCVADNNAYYGYEKIIRRLKGYNDRRFCLQDIFKDAYGNYHDCWIFELIRKEEEYDI